MSSSSQYEQRAVWGWGTTFDAEEARAFLAQRVALYARLIGLFFSLLYAAGIVLVLAAAPERIWAVHLHVAELANLVVVAIAFGVWWLVRRPGCPDLPIIVGDAAIPLVLSLSVAAPFIPPGFSLAMSFVRCSSTSSGSCSVRRSCRARRCARPASAPSPRCRRSGRNTSWLRTRQLQSARSAGCRARTSRSRASDAALTSRTKTFRPGSRGSIRSNPANALLVVTRDGLSVTEWTSPPEDSKR